MLLRPANTRTSLLAALLLVPALAPAAKPDLPKPAMKALESANGILGTTAGDERVLACIDALPFLDIVVSQAPGYAYAVGLAAECRYLTDDYQKAVPLLEKYIALVPPKARKGEVADKVEKAELRLMKAKAILAERQGPEPKPAEPPKPVIVVKQPEPPPPPEPPKPVDTVVAVRPAEPPAPPPPPPEPPEIELPLAKEFALRAGLAPEAGALGLSAELRLGNLAFSVGSGGYPVGGGVRYLFPAGPGAAYAEGHAVWVASSPFVRRVQTGAGFGVTAGYDYRPLPMLSVKVGLGVAHVTGRGTGLVLDAAVGPVFEF